MAKTRPILTPPVQVSHVYYRLTRVLVWSGITRYFRIRGLDGFDTLPKPGTPAIFISNHQNGMMDPMPICAFIPQQMHYLTGPTCFGTLFSGTSCLVGTKCQCTASVTGSRICATATTSSLTCADRMEAGAAMALFPEGNHNPFPFPSSPERWVGGNAGPWGTQARQPSRHPVDPHWLGLRALRRLAASCACAQEPIPYADCLNEDGTMDKVTFHNRVTTALKQVAVDIQPADAHQVFHDGIRANEPPSLMPTIGKPSLSCLRHGASDGAMTPHGPRVSRKRIACGKTPTSQAAQAP